MSEPRNRPDTRQNDDRTPDALPEGGRAATAEMRDVPAEAWAACFPAAGVSERDALDVVWAATKGLEAEHKLGVLHGDVHPGNIRIPVDGRGLPMCARAMLVTPSAGPAGPRGSAPELPAPAGTLGFAAPERIADPKSAKKPSDVFSMGATLYRLLTGASPFAGTDAADTARRTSEARYVPMAEARPGLSRATVAVVDRCLERHPEKRFRDASTLRQALDVCLMGGTSKMSGEDTNETIRRIASVQDAPAPARGPATGPVTASVPAPAAPAAPVPAAAPGSPRAAARVEPETASTEVLVPPAEQPASGGAGKLALLAGVLAVVAGGWFVFVRTPSSAPLDLAGLTDGVRVHLGAEVLGADSDIPVGPQELRLVRGPQYADQTVRVEVRGGETVHVAEQAWVRRPGTVSMVGLSDGVEAWVGGRRLADGTELPEGRHAIVLRRGASWEEQPVTLDVGAGAAVVLRETPWVRSGGKLRLTELGGDVEVTLGGVRVADGAACPEGRCDLILRKHGSWVAQRVVVEVGAGEERVIRAGPWQRAAASYKAAELTAGVKVFDGAAEIQDGAFLDEGTHRLTLRRGPEWHDQVVVVEAAVGGVVTASENTWRRRPGRLVLQGISAGVDVFEGDRRVADGEEAEEGRLELTLHRQDKGWLPQTVVLDVRAAQDAAPAERTWERAPVRVVFRVEGGTVVRTGGSAVASGDLLPEGVTAFTLSRGADWETQSCTLTLVSGGDDGVVTDGPWKRSPLGVAKDVLESVGTWDKASVADRGIAAAEIDRLLPEMTFTALTKFSCAGAEHELAVFEHAATGLAFVLLPGGTFELGSPATEAGRDTDEKQRPATVTPFLVARTELTQDAWLRRNPSNPSAVKDRARPVEQVSWTAARDFCAAAGLSLPTEAQWEFACRAGTTTAFSFGESQADMASYGWCSATGPRPAAQGSSNAFGLLDVHGNVGEWCLDNYETHDAQRFVWRGGCWQGPAAWARSAWRDGELAAAALPYIGVRPVRNLDLR